MVARDMLSLDFFVFFLLEITTQLQGLNACCELAIRDSQAMLMAMLVLWMLHQAQAASRFVGEIFQAAKRILQVALS